MCCYAEREWNYHPASIVHICIIINNKTSFYKGTILLHMYIKTCGCHHTKSAQYNTKPYSSMAMKGWSIILMIIVYNVNETQQNSSS